MSMFNNIIETVFRNYHEHSTTNTNQDMCAYTCFFSANLTLQTNYATEQTG